MREKKIPLSHATLLDEGFACDCTYYTKELPQQDGLILCRRNVNHSWSCTILSAENCWHQKELNTLDDLSEFVNKTALNPIKEVEIPSGFEKLL